MKLIGIFLVAISFTGSAYISVLDNVQIQWIYYLPILAVGVLGIVFLKLHQRQIQGDTESQSQGLQSLTTSLQNIVEHLSRLTGQSEASESNLDFHTRFDETFAPDLAAFVESRKSIAHRYGLQAYADIMSSFASAERYLNRVWSASADGYIDEVNDYLTRAQEQFSDSLARLKAIQNEPES